MTALSPGRLVVPRLSVPRRRVYDTGVAPGASVLAPAGFSVGAGTANQASVVSQPGGSVTVEKPTRVFGTMCWVGVIYVLAYSMWRDNIRPAGGDGLLISYNWAPGQGGSDVASWVYARPAAEAPDPMFFGFYTSNRSNFWAPFVGDRTPVTGGWWNDTQWAERCSFWQAEMGRILAAGYVGLLMDTENYHTDGPNGESPPPGSPGYQNPGLWDGVTIGNHFGYSLAATRAKVYERGAQLGTALRDAAGPNNLKIVTYGSRFPGTWDAQQQEDAGNVAQAEDFAATSVIVDFWAGLLSVTGAVREVNFLEAVHYKGTQVRHWPDIQNPSDPPASWDDALSYDATAYRSMFNTEFNDAGLAGRCRWVPFGWIDQQFPDSESPKTSDFSHYRGQAHVNAQFTNFAEWVQNPLHYTPMVADFGYWSFNWPYNAPMPPSGVREAPPGALGAFGKFSRRLGTAPAAY